MGLLVQIRQNSPHIVHRYILRVLQQIDDVLASRLVVKSVSTFLVCIQGQFPSNAADPGH